ncbi:MAG TPA: ornithine cyclodeaminase family protein [Candidatus Angelobacter sp.]|nr:ornithine cyclodeaminase family protein [Candidatus Angelobacter sp.]
MLFLTEEQFRCAVNADQAIAAIRKAFARDYAATLHMPVRTSLELDGAILLIMPCYDSALNAAGVKLVSVSSKGVNAVYELLDPATGIAVAHFEANYLTDLRTAATSAVATDLLAREDVKTLGIFGSGRQAAIHFAVLPRVRRFERFLVTGSGRSDLSDFCAKMKAEQGIEVEQVTAERCARDADVICTCTTAVEPLFDGRWLRPGAHLNLVGAFQPHTREVDDETVRHARVVVDTYDGALAEAGDLLIPMKNGTIAREDIIGDLHEIASGKKRGRNSRDDITLFKSVGCALEDLVTAQLAVSTWKDCAPNKIST